MCLSKKRYLDGIGYEYYGLFTPDLINHSAFTMSSKEGFLKWKKIYNNIGLSYENYIRSEKWVTHESIVDFGSPYCKFCDKDRVYDEMYVQYATNLKLILIDNSVKYPLKKEYYYETNKFKKYVGKILNARNVFEYHFVGPTRSKITSEIVQTSGFVCVSFDITDEFNEFQELLEYKLKKVNFNSNINNINNNGIIFDNRRYFTNINNANDMNWLKWDKKTNKIEYILPIVLYSNLICRYDTEKRIFNFINDKLLAYILQFFDKIFAKLVCKKWNYLV